MFHFYFFHVFTLSKYIKIDLSLTCIGNSPISYIFATNKVKDNTVT